MAVRISPALVAVLLEDGVALGFADLLEDDLLGHLGGDAAERRGVLVEAKLAAGFDFRRELAGGFEGELVVRIFDFFGGLDDGLEDVGADFSGLAVELAAHVFDGLVELARGEGDGVLNGADDDLGVDALFAGEKLDGLIEWGCHFG